VGQATIIRIIKEYISMETKYYVVIVINPCTEEIRLDTAMTAIENISVNGQQKAQ